MCIVWGQGWGMNQPTQWRIAMLNAQRLGIHGGAVAAIFYEMLPGTVITVPNKPWQGRIMGCSAWDKLVHVGWVFNSPPFLFNFLHHIPTLTQRHKPPNSVCICSVILKVVCMYPKELTLFILFFFFSCAQRRAGNFAETTRHSPLCGEVLPNITFYNYCTHPGQLSHWPG